jgi:serine/threonine protein kinase
MSPEQIRTPSKVGPASDIYALCALTYHLLSGSPPFAAENAGAVLMAHLRTAPPDIRAAVPELSSEISEALARALAKSAQDVIRRRASSLAAWADYGMRPGVGCPCSERILSTTEGAASRPVRSEVMQLGHG